MNISATKLVIGISLCLSSAVNAQADDVPKAAVTTTGKVSALPRVFVANLNAGSGASKGEASLLNDALLVAIKAHEDKFEIRTRQDIEGIMELEVAQTLSGCDVVSCAAEIGDALGAEQLVTGQLGRVGNTWLLSLTRTERSTLKALSRTQVRAVGEAPDVLFPLMEAQVAEVFGQEPPPPPPVDVSGDSSSGLSPLLLGGGAAVAVGVVSLAVAGVAYWVSFNQYEVAKDRNVKLSEFNTAVDTGWAAYWVSVGALTLGASLIVIGGASAATSFALGGE